MCIVVVPHWTLDIISLLVLQEYKWATYESNPIKMFWRRKHVSHPNDERQEDDANVEWASGKVAKHPLVRKLSLTDFPFRPWDVIAWIWNR